MEFISLSDIASYKQGKQVTVEKQYLNRDEGLVRFVRIVDFTNPDEPPRYIENLGEQYIVSEKDIVMIRYGSQTAGTVVRGISGIIANNMFQICLKDNRFDVDYLYYFLSSRTVKEMLMSGQSSSTMPAITFGMLKQIKIPLIDIEEQRKIAFFIEKINDKIKLNKKINDNLEQQAQTIYAHMFETEVAELWKTGTLSDIAEITMGQSPSGNSYNEDKQGTVFFQGRAEFGFRFPTVRLYTTEPKRIALKNDTLMSVRAPVGDLNIAHENCCIGRGLAAIRSKDNHQSFVHYTMFSLQKELNVFNGEGTVFGSINRNALNSMPIKLPPEELINKFEDLVSPIDALILSNHDAICRLQIIRDALLPKLLTGVLNITDLDI